MTFDKLQEACCWLREPGAHRVGTQRSCRAWFWHHYFWREATQVERCEPGLSVDRKWHRDVYARRHSAPVRHR